MCTGAELALVAGAATAAGSGASMYANNQALKQQDEIAAQGIARQAALQRQANQTVQQTVQKAAADEGQNLEQNRMLQQQQYAAALQRAAPVQQNSLQDVAGASKRYAQGVVDARAANANYGNTAANLMARTDAPQLTQLGQQLTLGDAATKLGMLNDTSGNLANLTKLQANAVQPNPWLMAASGILKGVGAGASVYGAGAAGAGSTTDSAGYLNKLGSKFGGGISYNGAGLGGVPS